MMNVGLIGFGYWGPNVAKNLYNNKKISLHTICDKKPERLDIAKSIYIKQTNYETDWRKVVYNDEIEAVAIAIETSAHFELAMEVLKAGKHVYVEKPFTSTSEEAEKLTEAADNRGLIVHVDHIMMYHPVIRKIKQLVDNRELGDLLYFDASRMNLGQIKQDVSAMWDLAIHDLSIIDYFLDGFNPDYISAVGEKRYSSKETLTFLTMKEGKFVSHLKSSWISPLKERRIILAGNKKMVVYDDVKTTEKLMIFDKGVDIMPESNLEYNDYVVKTRTGDCLIPNIETEDALYNSIEHFRFCIENDKESISGPKQAIRLLRILENADHQMCDR